MVYNILYIYILGWPIKGGVKAATHGSIFSMDFFRIHVSSNGCLEDAKLGILNTDVEGAQGLVQGQTPTCLWETCLWMSVSSNASWDVKFHNSYNAEIA